MFQTKPASAPSAAEGSSREKPSIGAVPPPRPGHWRFPLARLFGARWIAIFSFAVLAVFLVVSLGFSSQQIQKRQSDYEILSAASALRSLSIEMTGRAGGYLARANSSSDVEAEQFIADASRIGKEMRAALDLLASCDQPRRASTECDLPARSRELADELSSQWTLLEEELDLDSASADSRTIAAEVANRYLARSDNFERSSGLLFSETSAEMEKEMARTLYFIEIAAAIAGLLTVGLISLLYHRFSAPMRHLVSSLRIASRGPLGHQISFSGQDEIGDIVSSFNRATKNADRILRLTGEIHLSNGMDGILRSLLEHLRPSLPIDWIGLYEISGGEALPFTLKNQAPPISEIPAIGNALSDSWISSALASGKTQALPPDLQTRFTEAMRGIGLQSLMIVPLISQADLPRFLIFASHRPKAYSSTIRSAFLTNLSSQINAAIERLHLPKALSLSAAIGIAKFSEERLPHLHGHSDRVAAYASIIAEKMRELYPREGIPLSFAEEIREQARLLDIGSIAIPETIYRKGGALEEHEEQQVRMHPVIGSELLRRFDSAFAGVGCGHPLSLAIEIAENHHERHDGSGYPLGLKGEAIPLSARIVAVADVLDALLSPRPYRKAWSLKMAITHISRKSGTSFDPEVVEALRLCSAEIERLASRS